MGQQPSKSTAAQKGKDSDSLQSYPSFTRTDTQGSTRSLRNSLKTRISNLSIDKDKSTNERIDKEYGRSPRSDTSSLRSRPSFSREDMIDEADVPQQPPSPVHGEIGRGHKKEHAPGEVVESSDICPKKLPPSPVTTLPSEPILRKRSPVDDVSAMVEEVLSAPSNSMETMGLRSVDLDDMISRLLDAGYAGKVTKSVCLKSAEILSICLAVREVFLSQPALLELSQPVKIVGDVHGQFNDLIRLFEMSGFPPSANFLFLGDYVDRGKQSLETILLLFCYKLKYPENFFLLRGNHECANVTRVYGFYDECKRRTNIKIWKTFIDSFNTLPIAAVVASKIFCVHGGLSPSLNSMDEIRAITRPTDVPDYGLLNDLLWSDPGDIDKDWEESERGVSYCFGKNVILNFLAKHGFDLVCRAHMVVEDGYEFFNDRTLVTVFSAPNYCGEFDNWGAVMSVSDELLCSFELLKPLDSTALKQQMKKSRKERGSMVHSPVCRIPAPAANL